MMPSERVPCHLPWGGRLLFRLHRHCRPARHIYSFVGASSGATSHRGRSGGHVESAVVVDGLPGDVAVAENGYGERGELLGLAEPTHRDSYHPRPQTPRPPTPLPH